MKEMVHRNGYVSINFFKFQIITSGGVTYKNEPWHRECFTCSNCSTSLAGQRFTSKDEKPYCGDCFGELFAKRCTSCVKPITGESRLTSRLDDQINHLDKVKDNNAQLDLVTDNDHYNFNCIQTCTNK